MARFYKPTQARPIDYGYQLDWRPFAAGAQHQIDSADKYGESLAKMDELFAQIKVTPADQPLLNEKLAPLRQEVATLAKDYTEGRYSPATPKGRMRLNALTQKAASLPADKDITAMMNTYQGAAATRENVLTNPQKYDHRVVDIINKGYSIIGSSQAEDGLQSGYMPGIVEKIDKAAFSFKFGEKIRVDESLASRGYQIIPTGDGVKLLKQGSRGTETLTEQEVSSILMPLLNTNEDILAHENILKWGVQHGIADPSVLDEWNKEKETIVKMTARAMGINNIKTEDRYSVIGGQGDGKSDGGQKAPITIGEPATQIPEDKRPTTKAVMVETAQTLEQLDKNRPNTESGYTAIEQLLNVYNLVSQEDSTAPLHYPAEVMHAGGSETQRIVLNLDNESNYDWELKDIPDPTKQLKARIKIGRMNDINIVGATLSGKNVPVSIAGSRGQVFDFDASVDDQVDQQLNTYTTTQNNVFSALQGREISTEDLIRFFPQFTTDSSSGPALIDVERINKMEAEFEKYVAQYPDAVKKSMIADYKKGMNSLRQMLALGQQSTQEGGVVPTHMAIARQVLKTEGTKGVVEMGVDGELGFGGTLKIGDQAVNYQYSQSPNNQIGNRAEVEAMKAISAIRRPFNMFNNITDRATVQKALTMDGNADGIPITDRYMDYTEDGTFLEDNTGIVTWDFSSGDVHINFQNGDVQRVPYQEFVGELEADYRRARNNKVSSMDFLRGIGMDAYLTTGF